jgi:MOSC domain-containing protein YiiM
MSRSGELRSINVSGGGVPKRPQERAVVTKRGLEGDCQRNLTFHGGPNRAVSLYSMDLIETMQAHGHPVEPGSMGENLTIAGIDWTEMVVGTRVQVGDVELELTAFAAPCRNITGSFADGDITRVSQKRHPGWSRVYARVLTPGSIRVGDTVRIELDEDQAGRTHAVG